MIRQTLSFLIISFVFTSCAALGTKTLYRNEIYPEIKKLAFAKIEGNRMVAKKFPQTDSIFNKTFIETFNSYNLYNIVPLNSTFLIDKPDTSKIIKICNENNYDGLVITRIKFIHISYAFDFSSVAKNWDTEVEMKLFDKTGNLLLSILHNTIKGNSYFMPPIAERTVHDGTAGAIKRMAKELGLTKKNVVQQGVWQ